MPGATIGDLSLETFKTTYLPQVVAPDILEENQRSTEEQLASQRLMELQSKTPTNAGIIVLGIDPLSFLPGAYLSFTRYQGEDLSDLVADWKTLGGNLLTQLQELDNLLPIQIRTTRVPGAGLRHEDIHDYPLLALRELILNAVMHRSYEGTHAPVRINWFEDRVEIQNPGGLYGQVTPENFGKVTDYRNPVLAEALKALGYVEKFGAGISRVKAALKKNGNPPPEFSFEATYTQVTVKSRL